MSYKKVRDGYPLRLWRATTEIDADPEVILKRIVHERYVLISSVVRFKYRTYLRYEKRTYIQGLLARYALRKSLPTIKTSFSFTKKTITTVFSQVGFTNLDKLDESVC